MDRKTVLVVVALVVIAMGYLVVRDPVGAAGVVRQGWDFAFNAVATVFESLVTFVRSLLRG